MVEAEGEAAFLSPGVAELRPPWTSSGLPLGPLLGWSLRGQGHGTWLRCGAANGLAQLGWARPEKDAGHGPVGHTIPHLHHPLPLLVPFSGNGLQFLQLLRGQMNSFSFKGGGRDLQRFGLGQDA